MKSPIKLPSIEKNTDYSNKLQNIKYYTSKAQAPANFNETQGFVIKPIS